MKALRLNLIFSMFIKIYKNVWYSSVYRTVGRDFEHFKLANIHICSTLCPCSTGNVCLGWRLPRGRPRPRRERCDTDRRNIFNYVCNWKGAVAVKKHVEDDNYAKNLVRAIMRHMSWEFTPLFVLCDFVIHTYSCTHTQVCVCECVCIR